MNIGKFCPFDKLQISGLLKGQGSVDNPVFEAFLAVFEVREDFSHLATSRRTSSSDWWHLMTSEAMFDLGGRVTSEAQSGLKDRTWVLVEL